MITDERFLNVPLRVANNEIQKQYIEEWTMQYTVDEIVEKVLAKGIPAAPIFNVKQITEDEQIAKAIEMFIEIDHPTIGRMKVNGSPIKLMDMMTVLYSGGAMELILMYLLQKFIKVSSMNA